MADPLTPTRRRTAANFEAEARQNIAQAVANDLAPSPLTPKDCDVSSYPGFIVQASRLQNSEFWMLSSNRMKVAAIELWMFAWRQVPAASLPDNPKLLSSVTGIPANQIREMLRCGAFHLTAFHGFVRCSDGRLYHPVLAGDALRAWQTSQAREKAANERHQRTMISQAIGSSYRSAPRLPTERRGSRRYEEDDY